MVKSAWRVLFFYSTLYDKFLHFSIPLLMTIIAYEFFVKDSKLFAKEKAFFYILGINAAFEIFEYFQSKIFNFPSVGVYLDKTMVMARYPDTIWDLVACCGGCLAYLLFLRINEMRTKTKKK